MGHHKGAPVEVPCDKRKYERFDQSGNAQLAGLAAYEPGRSLLLTAFQELLKDDLLRSIHNQ
jgi:hypothetical protein